MTKKKVQPRGAKGKAGAQDESVREVAQHVAALLYLDATPAELHNAILDWAIETEAVYVNHIRRTDPAAYAGHLFPILKRNGGAR